MNLKEAIKILAQFEELFGDGGNGDDDKKKKEKKEIKWQFPEAWETEVVEADWVGIPVEIREAVMAVGEDPIAVLKWALEHEDEKAVKWILNNKVNINELDEGRLLDLGYFPSVGFVIGIIRNYAVDKRAKQLICEGMLIRGIEDADEDIIEEALRVGADINKLDSYDLWELGWLLPFDFVKKIEKKYVTSEKARRIIYEGVIAQAGDLKDEGEDIIRKILASKRVDVNKLENTVWKNLAERCSTDFLEEVISKYNIGRKAKSTLLKEVLRKGLEEKRWGYIMLALKNGVEVSEEDEKRLNARLGPDWKKYLPRRKRRQYESKRGY